MENNIIQAVVLAAGKSTRLAGKNKLLEKICGRPMIIFTTTLLQKLNIKTLLVVGHQQELVKKCITMHHPQENIHFVTQEEQHGTGHALACTQSTWSHEHILIMNGDMPLVTADIIQSLYDKHIKNNADISFVIAHHAEPNTSYGRVIINENNISIIEANEFQGDSVDHCCINAGIYLIKRTFLEKHIHSIVRNQRSKEFYITELINTASALNAKVEIIKAPFDTIRGINTQHELWTAEQIQRSNIIKYWMEHGVRFSVAHNVHIDLDVSIGAGSYIGCGAHLLYGSKIGTDCRIHEYSSIENSTIGNNSCIYPFSIIKNTSVGNNAHIGPFAHIKDHTVIDSDVCIGNFVEIKNSIVHTGAKAKHLSYIGDAQIGKNVNIGAGTITCNYNGTDKHTTIIKDNAFVGSNNTLVAPITLGQGSYTAGGSTITNDVPDYALALGRAQQINKDGYAKKLTKQASQETQEDDTLICCHKIQAKKAEFLGATKTINDNSIEHDSR